MFVAQATSLSNEERARVRTRRWAIFSVVVLASAQIAIPLSTSFEPWLTSLVVAVLAVSTYLFARSGIRSEQLAVSFLVVAVISFLVEALGVRTGWPFGNYAYTDRLHPRLLSVPLIVPLAWFALSMSAREVARRLVPMRYRWGQWLLGGYLLAAYDMFLDPQMTHAGFWFWTSPGWWQGVPFSNYVGWFLIGAVLVAIVDILLSDTALNGGLVFLYAWMSFMSAFGFLLPFAFDRPSVGLVGGACTLPFALFALWRAFRSWRAFQS